MPWCHRRDIPLMAYSPIEQGRLPRTGALREVARAHDATPAQVMLAWVLRQGAMAIPKAGRVDHVEENRAALDLELTSEDLAALDPRLPPPTGPVPLDVL